MTGYFFIVTLLLAGAAAAAGLVGVWAATSRGHWFWRALAVWACPAAMLPIRAYEPALVFAISLPLTVLVIRCLLWVRGRWSKKEGDSGQESSVIRFGLSDLLLATALLGLTLAVLIHVGRKIPERTLPPRAIREILVPSAALLALATLSWFATSGRRQRWAGLGLVVLVPALAWALWPDTPWLYTFFNLEMGLYYALGGYLDSYWRGYYLTAAGLAESAVLVMAALATRALAFSASRASRAFAACHYGLLAIGGVGLGALYVPMLWLTPFPPRVVTPDNQYARIMEIAQRVESLNENSVSIAEIETSETRTAEELRSLYSELLPLLEAPNALGLDLAAVADRRLHDRTTSDQAKRLRVLGKALEAESKSAAKEGDFESAVAFALADVRLGTVFCRSGVMIDAMIGHAVMGRGSAQLAAIRQQLDPALGRKVSEALQASEALHEPAAAICRRDMAYCEDLYGWQVRLSNIVERITNGPQMQWEGSQAFSGMVDRWFATSRMLQTDFAIRRFRAEEGQLPGTLEDLVPKYLPVVPLDPFTQRPLVYRAAGDEFTLYSVGDDGADNGGKFTDRKTYLDARFRSGYDYDLDTFTRP